jgi:lysophospholipase L1-like esterase
VRGAIVAIVAALALGALPAGAATRSLQHVTLIGDSVSDGISGDSAAVQTLSQGINLDLETAACRRVDGTSCPPGPPTVVDVVHSMGSKLGPNVVIAVGYNDFEDQYAQNIETALTALKAAGVEHVWWLTLRAARHPYLSMNDDIEAAAQKHPELRVIDWNVYSRSHPDWFQPDGLHLLASGSKAMATLIHRSLLDADVAAPPIRITTASLPGARLAKPYRAQLAASGGSPPYRFSLLGRPPLGIHLLANGVLDGRARSKLGAYVLHVQVKDSDGVLGTRAVTLRVTK